MIGFVIVPRPRPLVEDGVPKAHVIVLLGQVKPDKGVAELWSGAPFGQAIPAAIAVLTITVVVIIIATTDNILFFPMRVP